MPRELLMPYQTTNTSTLLFLSIFILAFFPNIFNQLITLPFALPAYFLISNPRPQEPDPPAIMSFSQKHFTLPSKSRGAYLITDHVVASVPEIVDYKVGILHLFVQHTSCGLTMNENWDEDVRTDMNNALDRIAPHDNQGKQLYKHSAEGLDDMPVGSRSTKNLV